MKKLLLFTVGFLFTLVIAIHPTYAATGPITYQDGFDWYGPEINVTYDKYLNKFDTNFNVSDYMIDNDGETYYVSTTGDDSNDGLTEETPLATVHAAMDKIDVNTIYIDEGTYYLGEAFNNDVYTSREVNIIGIGDVILSAMTNPPVWTLEDGYTAVYSEPSANVTDVYDMSQTDADGAWKKYTKVDSIALVESTPESYYLGTDPNKIYVHNADGSEPSADIVTNRNVYNLRFTTSSTVYLENLTFLGGQGLMIENSTVYAKDVSVKYSLEAGVSVKSSNAYIDTGEFLYNNIDGIGYSNTLDPTVIHYALEKDIISAYNGLESEADNVNGSSMHGNQRGIRINGFYHNNKGPNIIDVDSSQSINYGTTAYNSRAAEDNWSIDYHIQEQTTDNKMWLINKKYVVSNSAYRYLASIENLFDLTYHVVSFDTNQGRELLDLFVLNGTIVDAPLTSKTDYTFSGWYVDEDLSNEFDFSETEITDDVHLYARWSPQTTGGYVFDNTGDAFTIFGIEWYWLAAIGAGVYILFGTKKGRKAIGLK